MRIFLCAVLLVACHREDELPIVAAVPVVDDAALDTASVSVDAPDACAPSGPAAPALPAVACSAATATAVMAAAPGPIEPVALQSGRLLSVVHTDLQRFRIFDPSTDSWSEECPGHLDDPYRTDGYYAFVVPLEGDSVLLAGGLRGGYKTGLHWENGCARYDRATGEFRTVAPLAVRPARNGAVAVRLFDGRVLVVGDGAQMYDPVADAWRIVAPLDGRAAMTATLLSDRRVLFVGGLDHEGALATTTWLFEPSCETREDAPPPLHSRRDHVAAQLPDGRILVGGGQDAKGLVATSEIFDLRSKTWSVARPMPIPLMRSSAIVMPCGEVVLAGGADAAGIPRAVAQIYMPLTDEWRVIPLAWPRVQPAVGLFLDGTAFVAGGWAAEVAPTLERLQ